MAEELMLSFEFDAKAKKLNIAFDKNGAKALTETLKYVVKSKGHAHDHVGAPEIGGALTRKRYWGHKGNTKILAIQYEYSDDPDDWDEK
jgi:hypothetical protein